MNLYSNAELEFKFEVQNPIIQLGRIRIFYPTSKATKFDAAVAFDKTKALLRCFDNTCTTNNIVIEHDQVNKYVDISKLFEAPEYVRKTGFEVRFSISGWTLAAPSQTDTTVTNTFHLETKWKEDASIYSIDRLEGFLLTMNMPSAKPIISYDSSFTYAGSVTDLKVRYNL